MASKAGRVADVVWAGQGAARPGAVAVARASGRLIEKGPIGAVVRALELPALGIAVRSVVARADLVGRDRLRGGELVGNPGGRLAAHVPLRARAVVESLRHVLRAGARVAGADRSAGEIG